MINSVKFRIEGDNSSAMRSLSDFGGAVHKVGHEIQEEIGGKIEHAFSVVFIEEAVRRTGEWANELAKSAQELGVSAEEMQALRLAAEKAGVSVDKVLRFYDKIESAARSAANGNLKLQQSFKTLGIPREGEKGYVHGSPNDLVQAALKGARPNNPGGQQALMNLFGSKNPLELAAIQNQLGGKTLEEYGKDHESQIVPNKDVRSMAIAWDNILDDFKAVGVKLAPVGTLLLNIVDGITKMINGLAASFEYIIKTVYHLGAAVIGKIPVVGNFLGIDSRDHELKNEDIQAQGKIRSKAAVNGILNLATLGLAKRKGWGFHLEGQNEEDIRTGEGMGEGLATLATFGYGAVTDAAGIGAKGLSAGAKAVGAEGVASSAGNLGTKLLNAGRTGSLLKRGLAGQVGNKIAIKVIKGKILKRLEQEGFFFGPKGELISKATGQTLTRPELDEVMEIIASDMPKTFQTALKTLGGASMAGWLASAGKSGTEDVANSNMFESILGGAKTRYDRTPTLNVGNMFGSAAGGNSNLHIGGVFGEDIAGKTLQLNSRMVDLLEKIVENTNPTREAAEGYVDYGDSGVANP